ncbi:hypothetical protein EW145_g8186, partial [Phellinidium pouzarii]
ALLVKPLPSFSLVVANIGAVDALTRGLAVDLAPVRVNVVSPGIVKTEFIDLAPEMREKMYEDAERKLLVKHVADPDEIAEAYLFLMKCGYITGQRIEVDGGGNAPSIIMEKLSVLIIGATGRTGSSITDALLKHPNFHVIALVRPSSASKPAIAALQKRGVEIRVADLDPSAQEQLVEALRGADVVICAILGREIAPQYALIDAVKKAGVKRFVPNDWSPACTRGIRQLHDEGPTLTLILAKSSAPVMSKAAMIDRRDIGEFVARILVDERTLNRYVFCYGEEVTQSEIHALAERVSGTKVDAVRVSKEETVEQLETAQGLVRMMLEYKHSGWIRGDNTIENAKKEEYGSALDARELYPDLITRTLEAYAKEFYL